MGNKNSKKQEETPLEIKKHLINAMKDLAGEKIASTAMNFLNNPEDMLSNLTLPPKFKKWIGYTVAAATGSLITAGITGGHLLHLKKLGIVALKGLSMAAWASVLAYVALAANIFTIVAQIHYICETSQLLQKNNTYLVEVNGVIDHIKRDVVELLGKCNQNQWEELAEPNEMKKLDDILEKIASIQAEINLKIFELEKQKTFMSGLAIGTAGLSLLTVVGGACVFALAATGIGSFVLLGAVIATGVAVGIGAAAAAYYAYKCDKQLTDFKKAKAKLKVLSATLRSIKECIQTNSMKPEDVKEWLLKRGLSKLGQDANTLLNILEKEHYLVVDVVKNFSKKNFLKDIQKYNLKENDKDLLVSYLKEFQTKIESGHQLLGNLSENICDFDDYEDTLKKWGLKQYIENFKSEGYESLGDWKNLTETILIQDLQMKPGHAKRFVRRRKEYFKKYQYDN